jgi:hypothetical protein
MSASSVCSHSTAAADLDVLVEYRNLLKLPTVDGQSKHEWTNAKRMLMAKPEFSSFADTQLDDDSTIQRCPER